MYYIPYFDLRFLFNKTLDQIIIINQRNNHWIKMSKDLWDNLCSHKKVCLSIEDENTLIRHGLISNSDKEYLVYRRMMKSNDDLGYNIVFNLTDNCNLKCPYCFNESCSNRASKNKTVDEILNELSYLKIYKVNTITLSGGEPFMFSGKDLITIIKEAKLIAERVGINTNGTIIPIELDEIVKLCDTISVSLDGNNEETNSATRGKGSFQQTIEFIEKVVKLNCSAKLWLSVTASKYNYEYVPKILDIAKRYQIDIGVNFIFEIGSALDNVGDLRIPEESEKELRRRLFDYAAEINYPKYPGKFFVSEIQFAKKTCANANMLFIDDGGVYPCPGMKEDKYRLGKIKELDKCLNNPIRKSLIKLNSFDQYKYEKCYTCPAKFFCGGGCYAMEMTEQRCDYYKKHLSFLLWDFDGNKSLQENMKVYGENQYDIQVF